MRPKWLKAPRNPFADLSIRYKLFASYMLVILIPFVILLYLHLNLTANENEKQALYSARKMLDETKSYLQYRAETVKEVLNFISFNDTVQTLIAQDPQKYEDVNLWGTDANKLARVLNQFRYNSDIETVQLYMKQGLAAATENLDYMNMGNVVDTYWYKHFMSSHAAFTWLPSSSFELNLDNDKVSVLRVIPNAHNIQQSDGIVRAQISQETLRTVLNHAIVTPSTSVVLFNDQGDILSTSGGFSYTKQEFKEMLANLPTGNDPDNYWGDHHEITGERLLVGMQAIPETDMKVAMIVPYTDILKSSNNMRNRLFLIFFSIIPITFVLSFVVAGTATKRLRRLILHVRKVKNGNFRIAPLPANHDEIGELTRNFNQMVENVSELMDETYTLGREVKNKELKALQAQINPHFLYNTLDLINIMAIESGNPEISEVVDRLAMFYRLSLSNGEEIVTLGSELKHIESYVSIQNMRFSNSISLSMAVSTELYSCEVPKIMLQPLVENAILHGIMEKDSEEGTIHVSACLEAADLLITITDNGIGMSEAVVSALFSKVVTKGTGGFGIRNIQERLQINYGAAYGLSYTSKQGTGTSVLIRLPHANSVKTLS